MKVLKSPAFAHAKLYSREQTKADIASICDTIPLDLVNDRIEQQKQCEQSRLQTVTLDSKSNDFYHLS